MTTDVVIATRRQQIVRDEASGRVWLDTLLELDDGTYTLGIEVQDEALSRHLR